MNKNCGKVINKKIHIGMNQKGEICIQPEDGQYIVYRLGELTRALYREGHKVYIITITPEISEAIERLYEDCNWLCELIRSEL